MAAGELSAVAVLVLAMLNERPMHPYQVHQALVARGDARLVRITPGAVYHGVERLERDRLVEVVGTERAGNRPERTTYRLTDAGREAFARRLGSFLGDEHRDYPLFPVGLAEAHELPRELVLDQLTRRRARQTGRRDELLAAYERVRSEGLPRRYLLDVEHELALLRTELDWLDGVLAEIAEDALGWDEPFPLDFLRAHHANRLASHDDLSIPASTSVI